MEKETLVLDASVIVKWFCREEYTDTALEIRDRFFKGDLNIIVPELMFYEVSNAIRYNQVFSKGCFTNKKNLMLPESDEN